MVFVVFYKIDFILYSSSTHTVPCDILKSNATGIGGEHVTSLPRTQIDPFRGVGVGVPPQVP